MNNNNNNIFVKRKTLKIKEKLQIIEYASTHDYSLRKLAVKFKISKSQIWHILKSAKTLIQIQSDCKNLNSKKSTLPKDRRELENKLIDWIVCYEESKTLENNRCRSSSNNNNNNTTKKNLTPNLTPRIIRQKAWDIAKSMNIDNFKASCGWFDRFKNRYNVHSVKNIGEIFLNIRKKKVTTAAFCNNENNEKDVSLMGKLLEKRPGDTESVEIYFRNYEQNCDKKKRKSTLLRTDYIKPGVQSPNNQVENVKQVPFFSTKLKVIKTEKINTDNDDKIPQAVSMEVGNENQQQQQVNNAGGGGGGFIKMEIDDDDDDDDVNFISNVKSENLNLVDVKSESECESSFHLGNPIKLEDTSDTEENEKCDNNSSNLHSLKIKLVNMESLLDKENLYIATTVYDNTFLGYQQTAESLQPQHSLLVASTTDNVEHKFTANAGHQLVMMEENPIYIQTQVFNSDQDEIHCSRMTDKLKLCNAGDGGGGIKMINEMYICCNLCYLNDTGRNIDWKNQRKITDFFQKK